MSNIDWSSDRVFDFVDLLCYCWLFAFVQVKPTLLIAWTFPVVGAACISLERTIALYTAVNASWFMPWEGRTVMACIICAHFPMTSRTCSLNYWEMILIYVPRAVSGNIAGRSHPGVCVCRGKINIIPAILLDSVSAYSAGPTVLRALILCECCMPELQCACHLRTCAFDFLQ